MTSLPIGQSQASVQVRKSCSQATMAYSTIQASSTNAFDMDSFRSMNIDSMGDHTWQYRVGSLHFPQQAVVEERQAAVVGVHTTGGQKSYFEALYAFDKPKHPYHQGSVTFGNFWQGGKNVFAMSASKNDDLFLSGLPINNSRVLEFNLETSNSTGASVDRRLTTFLEYIQVVKCYVDNVAVAI